MKKKPKKHGRRNAPPAGSAPRRRYIPRRAPLPGWKDALAAVVGGAGSAVISGLAVNQKIVKPTTSAAIMIAGGGAAALLTEGTTRVVGNSVASAGAGQLALSLMAKRAIADETEAQERRVAAEKAAAEKLAAEKAAAERLAAERAAQAAAQRPQSDRGGGFVTSMFRDAMNELGELGEPDWRDADLAGADVYDLEDLAA
ncbi:MAG: hypothetical protein HS111_21990 [Kofleriaceae bacterium]|nr:hypothetical protein [Kofleriaceae bacterium]MCL4224364.1 hypothetical protein [Myxococcales bacterium]